ncbi:MAG: ATP synthase subunit I [Rhodocyclaceae bacterium]|nr:ATP synthase subunit I [Rhodocyclaceae bacterium]
MYRAIILQVAASVLTAAIAGIFAGLPGAISAALGGAAYYFPNLLFALRLSAKSRRSDASYPAAFFVGEALKLFSAVGLLAAVVHFYSAVVWPALLAGLIVTLQAGFFAFLKKT